MNEERFLWGDALSVALTIGFFAWMFWAAWRRKHRSDCVPDGPAGEAYRVYDTSFDIEVAGADVASSLRAHSPDRAKGWAMSDPLVWERKVAAAKDYSGSIDPSGGLAGLLKIAFDGTQDAQEWAICLLIDQSGSMRGNPMVTVAGAMRWLSRELTGIGAKCGVFGFSTVGWQGGRVRQQWLWNGRPKRPGRLCALLHVVYQPIGDPFTDEAWEAMLHPDILRENVDGEAIDWALVKLRERPEKHRLLIVVSDGAPVDDSTLEQNGPSFLERHIRAVIADAEASEDIMLAAVGVGYSVDLYYRQSESAHDLVEVPEALVNLITRVVAATEQK